MISGWFSKVGSCVFWVGDYHNAVNCRHPLERYKILRPQTKSDPVAFALRILSGHFHSDPTMKRNELESELTLEAELFLAVCRTALTSEAIQTWKDRSEGRPIDWELVLRMAAKHRVMPLLHRQVQANLRDRVPRSWYRRLENRVAANSERCEGLAKRLVDVQGKLCEEGIESLVFKGTVLGERIYRDMKLRQGWDIDVLVRQQKKDEAIHVLQQSGYEIVRRYDQAIDLVHRETGTPVDLHWLLTPKYFPYREKMESFFVRSIETQTSAGKVRTFCDEDLVAVLCLQIAKDAWERQQHIPYFFKVVDLAEALSVMKDMDWRSLRHRAKENGWLKILQLAVGACQRWLGLDEAYCKQVIGGSISKREQELVSRLGERVVCASAYDLGSEEVNSRPKGKNDLGHRLRQGLFFMQIREDPFDWVRYGTAVLYYGLPEFLFGPQHSRLGGNTERKHEQSEKVAT